MKAKSIDYAIATVLKAEYDENYIWPLSDFNLFMYLSIKND